MAKFGLKLSTRVPDTVSLTESLSYRNDSVVLFVIMIMGDTVSTNF